MRPVLASSLVLALAVSSALHAQQFTPHSKPFTLPSSMDSLSCPVDFSLERNNTGAVVPLLVLDASKAANAKRSVAFSLRSQLGRTITAADITLYAPRISNHTSPATVVFGQTEASELVTKTYHVNQGGFATGLLTGDLELLDTMAGVERAEIKSLTFADGTTWRPGDGASCIAKPRNFTLAAQK